MATVVNNPAPASSDNGSGMGFFLGILLLIIFAVLFLMYGVPYLSNSFRGPQVNIPGKVDVNVHTNGK